MSSTTWIRKDYFITQNDCVKCSKSIKTQLITEKFNYVGSSYCDFKAVAAESGAYYAPSFCSKNENKHNTQDALSNRRQSHRTVFFLAKRIEIYR